MAKDSSWRYLSLPVVIAGALVLASPSTGKTAGIPWANSWSFNPGLTLGGSKTIDSEADFILGGELSALYWWDIVYAGVVADALYDWDRSGYRMMFGPMIGIGFLGLDGGYLLDNSLGGLHHGGAVRAFISIGFFSLFVRYGALADAPDFVDFGLLIKVPIPFTAYFIEANFS